MRWRAFALGAPSQPFLELFLWLYYATCVKDLWSPLDFAPYTMFTHALYHPVGLTGIVGLPAPSFSSVLALRVAGTVSGLLAIYGRRFRGFAFVFFLCMLVMDAWRSMYPGFDASCGTRLAFGALFIVADLERARRGGPSVRPLTSLSFRAMELVAVLAYAQAAASKLWKSGLSWAIEPDVLQVSLIRWGSSLGVWVGFHRTLVTGLAASVLAMETLFFFYYLLPGRLRLLLFGAAAAFHLGTFALMDIQFVQLWLFMGSLVLVAPRLLAPVRGDAPPGRANSHQRSRP